LSKYFVSLSTGVLLELFSQINGFVSRSTLVCDASKIFGPANWQVLTPPQCFIAFLTWTYLLFSESSMSLPKNGYLTLAEPPYDQKVSIGPILLKKCYFFFVEISLYSKFTYIMKCSFGICPIFNMIYMCNSFFWGCKIINWN